MANKKERKQFFEQLFVGLLDPRWPQSPSGKELIEKIDKVVDETKGHSVDDIIRLYGALKSVIEADGGDLKVVNQKMDRIITQYARSRLQ